MVSVLNSLIIVFGVLLIFAIGFMLGMFLGLEISYRYYKQELAKKDKEETPDTFDFG